MSTKDTSFGVLTLASSSDYLKAIGLALSLRTSNPGVPIAIACSRKLEPVLAPYFDYVIEEHPGVRGFEHKVHLDEYTPFETTFFFDSDVLVFKPLKPYVELWGHPAYSAVGGYKTSGFSDFGLDRATVLKKIGFDRLTVIDGAGHACFRVQESKPLFDLARSITANYKDYAGDIKYADEDAVAIAMTMLQMPPAPYGDFFSRYLSAKPGTLEMDASHARCRFIWQDTNLPFDPCMMHFAANEAAIPYTRELFRLFRNKGVPTDGLFALGFEDAWTTHVKWPLHAKLKSVRRLIRHRSA
jgi:hypothetical protein